MLKRAITSAALAILSTMPAFAADLPARKTAPAPVFVTAPAWGGFYLGAIASYGWGNHEHRYYNPVTGALAGGHGRANADGAMIGGTLGYNIQSGSIVYGLEADISKSWMSGKTAGPAADPCLQWNGLALVPGGSCKANLNWFGTARGRIGYALGDALVYAAGGLAFGEVEAVRNWTKKSDWRLGWTLGAGVEYAINRNWSVKGEYLYADLGDKMLYGCPTCTTNNHKVKFDAHIVRLGLNYRFNTETVVAKY